MQRTVRFRWTVAIALLAGVVACEATPTRTTIGVGGGGNPNTAASLVIVSGNNQSGTVGAALTDSIVVRVLDLSSLPVPGATVTFTVLSGGGNVSPVSVTTDTTGLARARFALGSTPGTNTVQVSVSGTSIPSVIFSANAQ
ncbi:MAG: hypothetical protein M3068_00625 [Gemmatimonadota bacterium]|nr:hypothetical protein [Gemmatimonadota bacterium]